MTITRVVDGNTSAATNLNQLIDLMEGAETIDYLLTSLVATDFKVRLADAAGARKLIVQDSAGNTVAYIDSDGNASFTSMTLTSFVLPSAASPAQTADASIVWDSDGDFLTIGDGTSRKSFQPAVQGSNLASAATLNITDSYHRVTGTTTISAISTKPAGFRLTLTFAAALQLTHSSGLSLAGAANYTTTAEETLWFQSDGTNWIEVGRKPVTATTPGLVLVGSDTTERTTTSLTLVNLSSVTGLNIPTDQHCVILCAFRKTTGAADDVRLTLKVNSTVLSTGISVTPANNEAGSGLLRIEIGPRSATYVGSLIWLSSWVKDGGGTGKQVHGIDGAIVTANVPNATITSLTIQGQTDNASITLATDQMFVYTYATS